MSFEKALAAASPDESFKATGYAMNTLLINKEVYTQKEFQALFRRVGEQGTRAEIDRSITEKRQPGFGVVLPGC